MFTDVPVKHKLPEIFNALNESRKNGCETLCLSIWFGISEVKQKVLFSPRMSSVLGVLLAEPWLTAASLQPEIPENLDWATTSRWLWEGWLCHWEKPSDRSAGESSQVWGTKGTKLLIFTIIWALNLQPFQLQPDQVTPFTNTHSLPCFLIISDSFQKAAGSQKLKWERCFMKLKLTGSVCLLTCACVCVVQVAVCVWAEDGDGAAVEAVLLRVLL